MQVLLRTLAKADTHVVDDPQDERSPAEKAVQPKARNIERELIEEDLAQCKAFALEWSTKQKL